MAGTDLYRDFVFCRSTVLVGTTDTVIPVDDTSRIPDQATLDKSDFQLTFESTFSEGAFEVVKVTGVSANSITVLRGQDGSQPHPHAAYTILKGSLTAGMLRRARGAMSFMDIPAPDVDLYIQGDLAWDARFKRLYVLDGGAWRDAAAFAQSTADEAYALLSLVLNAVDDLEREAAASSPVAALASVANSVSDLQDHIAATDRTAVITTLVAAVADIQEARDVEAAERAAAMDPVTAAIALGG